MSEAAAMAGVHRNTIRAWCASGRLKSVRVNRRGERRVHHADVEQLVADRALRHATHDHARAGNRREASSTASRDNSEAGQLGPLEIEITRSETLRRITAEVSGAPDLPSLFEDVLDSSTALFSCDRAGLWLYDDSDHPLKLASCRDLPDELADSVASLATDVPSAGLDAIRRRAVVVLPDALDQPNPAIREMYRRAGIATVCFVPIVFRDEPLGLLALYHSATYDWTTDESELARSFADGMAAAIGSAKLYDSTQALAARLDAIGELAGRLNRITDAAEIGEAILAEVHRLIDYDTIRIYRIDHAAGMCEPIAFQGRFLGTENPSRDSLRIQIGDGLTGWVAEHNQALRIADAAKDPRGVIMGDASTPESMLLVPMSHEDRALGVIVVSQLGADRFDDDDERTLSIFAGYAAQALLNAENVGALRRQSDELEHQLASQRRLLEVNERLLSTLDPTGVLEMIADSLKTVVAYDTLTIYRIDWEHHVRRAVVARDRFADVILEYEGPLGIGITGWVIDHCEAVLANVAHLDPRSVQIPGTPFEPEAMIVVPLQVNGAVVGTLNVGRMGEAEAHFSENEFELTKLFAGQASIALQNAETHGAVKIRAEHDSLTGLRNHGAFQRELGEIIGDGRGEPFAVLMMDLDEFKAFNDTCGHPAGDQLLVSIARGIEGSVRDGDRAYRYGGDEFAVVLPTALRSQAYEIGERIRRSILELPDPVAGPRVTISVGVACFPEDGVTKDELVGAADQALYLVKPSSRSTNEALAASDTYLSILDETAMALMERLDTTTLLETIITRAANLLGTLHGYIYLVEEDRQSMVVQVGIGLFSDYIGYRMSVDAGVSGVVVTTGKPFGVDDYDAFAGRASDLPAGQFGAVVGAPLTSGPDVVGVIGLASGDSTRVFGAREIGALSRFAQLASIALDNARLAEAAQRGALYDPTTSLPNRELLMDRIGHSLSWAREGDHAPIAVILLDLDRFKVVNESVGHAVGDRLLIEVGRRLLASVRPGDTVARFGGDEFGIIIDGLHDPDDARRAAERISTELKSPFRLAGRDWFISASMGIALAYPGRATPGDVLREAEVALVRSKRDPQLRYAMFEPSMSEATIERVDIESDLRRALEHDELRLHYQPIVDLRTDRVIGLEALVRWQHPKRGLMAPLTFISVAEETGLIIPLGRWVLETACSQTQAWRTRFPDAPLSISVNLSARQFAMPDLVELLARTLGESGLPPSALELEITESVVMEESEAGTRTLRRLKDLGVRLALDDFGTGYSSLAYLRHLPLDTIKIDRSFVSGLDTDPANLPIVQAVISLAHGLGIDVVAEGIETLDEARRLRELGCDRGQGYVYARPMPGNEVTSLMEAVEPVEPVAGPGAEPVAGPVAGPTKRRSRRRATTNGKPAATRLAPAAPPAKIPAPRVAGGAGLAHP